MKLGRNVMCRGYSFAGMGLCRLAGGGGHINGKVAGTVRFDVLDRAMGEVGEVGQLDL